MRLRITLAVSLLVGLALAAAGLIAFAIQEDRIREQVNREIEQELGEFAALRGGSDPATGRAFTGAQPLIRTFLSRNVPDDDELLLGWWDDRPRLASPGHSLPDDPAFVDFLRSRVTQGGSAPYRSPAYGDLLVTVQPVEGRRSGALVVVTFLDETRAGLSDTIRT